MKEERKRKKKSVGLCVGTEIRDVGRARRNKTQNVPNVCSAMTDFASVDDRPITPLGESSVSRFGRGHSLFYSHCRYSTARGTVRKCSKKGFWYMVTNTISYGLFGVLVSDRSPPVICRLATIPSPKNSRPSATDFSGEYDLH